MTCPVCGARNGERARWCTQCYAVLDRSEGPADDGQDHPVPPPDGTRDVRIIDDQVEWRCTTCGAWNSLHEQACGSCGSQREGFTPQDHRREPVPRAGPVASLVAAALLPGLGHLLQGLVGLGSAVLLLWSLWGVSAVLSRSGGTPMTVVLGLAAAALWAGSLVDVWQRLQHRAPVLSSRALAWSTVGVTLLLVLVAIGGGLGARG